MLFKLFVLLSISCCVTLSDINTPKASFQVQLQQRRLKHHQIIERNKQISQKSGHLIQRGLPFDYLGTGFGIGTPEDDLALFFMETGSSQTWVVGGKYPHSLNNYHYDPKNSTTSQIVESNVEGKSGIYTLKGDRYVDKIKFISPSKWDQKFNVINQIQPDNVFDKSFIGILGLGWIPGESTKPNKNASFVINMFEEFYDKVFSIWVKRDFVDNKNATTSIFFYGGIDSKVYCQPDLMWFPVIGGNDQKTLRFQMNGFKFDRFEKRNSYYGLLETGLSVVMMPPTVIDVLIRKLDANWDWKLQLFVADCDKRDVLPDWIFTIGGRDFPLSTSYYLIDIGAPNNKCVAAFDDTQYDGIDFVFGLPMLRQYCSNFDINQNRVGLSTANHK